MTARTAAAGADPHLTSALAAAGLDSEADDRGVWVDGHWWQTITLAHPTPAEATSHARPRTLVVADRLSAEVRDELARGGAAWVDRRGELWFPGSPAVSASFPAQVAPPERVVDVFTPTGLDIAVTMLARPAHRWGVQELARTIGRSPGRVSELLRALRHDGLVDEGGRPLVPELFWEAARAWRPRWRPIPDGVHLGSEELANLGVVVGGTWAALAWEAPVVVSAEAPIELFVADRRDLDRLLRPAATGSGDPAGLAQPAYAAQCPAPVAAQSQQGGREVDGLPVVSHVAAALDLATDAGRGQEVLDGWHPRRVDRVW